MRLQLAGHTCRYLPGAVVFHIGSATTGSAFNPFVARCLARNKFFLFVKNVPLGLMWSNWHQLVRGEAFRFCHFARQRRVLEYFAGVFEASLKLPKMLKKRKGILRSRRVNNHYIRRMMLESEQWARQRNLKQR
jgi:GT2 family glycosyltransferase